MVRTRGLFGVGLAAAVAMIGLAAPVFADTGTATGDNTAAVTTPSTSATPVSPSPSTTTDVVPPAPARIQPSTVAQGGQVKILSCLGVARSAAFGRVVINKPWTPVTVRTNVAPGRYPVFVTCTNGKTTMGALTVIAAQQTTTTPVGGIGTGGGGAASQIG